MRDSVSHQTAPRNFPLQIPPPSPPRGYGIIPPSVRATPSRVWECHWCDRTLWLIPDQCSRLMGHDPPVCHPRARYPICACVVGVDFHWRDPDRFGWGWVLVGGGGGIATSLVPHPGRGLAVTWPESKGGTVCCPNKKTSGP